ncbi:hypothetical protein OHB26_10520 [Nocardia sp. NBC_01503]|uniref:hypothetical protein n=1 Tax=Nocardia sp. NBC_01503 TaxID=2975997 RepID=UPI002E7BEF40|nr:hypothetical protein [Nocardia sp. NBC_01503]WTL34583.1 hypothetical protein OHB26_10520 [Nocardia sp. NBC_01503]
MERLPYIDQHSTLVPADRARTWSALLRTTCEDPDDLSTLPRGFTLDEADPPHRLALTGRHPFSRYALVFRLDEETPTGTRLTAESWGEFPGPHGRLYRALVIGTGGHRLVVRAMLRRIAGAVRA